MTEETWTFIERIPLGFKNGRTLRLRTRNGEVKGFWQDSGPNAGKWVDEDDNVISPSHAKMV